MTTVTFARLILLKDIRAQRYPLLIQLALVFTTVVLWLYTSLNSEGAFVYTWAGVFPFMIWLIGIFFLTVQVIQVDPAGREFRFLFTRPVPGKAIGLAKALFLTAFVMVPYWISLELTIAMVHVPFTPLDHVLLLIETIISCGAMLSIVVLFSVFLPSPASVFLAMIGTFIGGIFLLEWLASTFNPAATLPDHHGNIMILGGIFLILSPIAIVVRYWTKAFKLPLALAIGGLVLSLLSAIFLPSDSHPLFADQQETHNRLTSDQLKNIHMILAQSNGNSKPFNLIGSGFNNITFAHLVHRVRFEGIEPPYYVQTIDYHAVATLRSGKTIVSNYSDFPSHGNGGINTRGDSLISYVAGVKTSSQYDKEEYLDLLTFIPKFSPKEDLTGATVKGTITLDIRRYNTEGTFPLKSHVSFDGLRRHYEITNTAFSDDGVEIGLNKIQMPLSLRGDVSDVLPDDIQFLVVYRPYNQSLMQGGGGASSIYSMNVHVSQQNYTLKSRDKKEMPDWKPLPPDWGKDAEIVFIGNESCGQVTLPYEISDVDLNYH